MLDERVMPIADAAASGDLPSCDEIVYLLQFNAYSPEAAYVQAKAREIGMRACKGRGYLYAQVGVDSTPCRVNCRFCSFAAVNAKGKAMVSPLLDVVIHLTRSND